MTPTSFVIRVKCPNKESLWIGPYEATPAAALSEGVAFAERYWPRPFTVVEYCKGSGSEFHLVPPPITVDLELI